MAPDGRLEIDDPLEAPIDVLEDSFSRIDAAVSRLAELVLQGQALRRNNAIEPCAANRDPGGLEAGARVSRGTPVACSTRRSGQPGRPQRGSVARVHHQ